MKVTDIVGQELAVIDRVEFGAGGYAPMHRSHREHPPEDRADPLRCLAPLQ